MVPTFPPGVAAQAGAAGANWKLSRIASNIGRSSSTSEVAPSQ